MDAAAQQVIDALDGVAYVLDASGAIIAYGRRNWDRFAIANGAPELADPRRVFGTNAVDLCRGEEVAAVPGSR